MKKSWRNQNDPQRVTKIKPFISKYNWEGITFSSEKDDWKKFEKNNVTIALNVLYDEKEKIYPAYISKHNSNRKKQVVFLMISIGEKPEWSKTLAMQAWSQWRETMSIGWRLWHHLAQKNYQNY